MYFMARELKRYETKVVPKMSMYLPGDICGLSAAAFYVSAMDFANSRTGIPVAHTFLAVWMLFLLFKAHNQKSSLASFCSGLVFSALWFAGSEELFAQMTLAVCVNMVFGVSTSTGDSDLNKRHILVWTGFSAGASTSLLAFFNCQFIDTIRLPPLPDVFLKLTVAFLVMQLFAVFKMVVSTVPHHKQRGVWFWFVCRTYLFVLAIGPIVVVSWVSSRELISLQDPFISFGSFLSIVVNSSVASIWNEWHVMSALALGGWLASFFEPTHYSMVFLASLSIVVKANTSPLSTRTSPACILMLCLLSGIGVAEFLRLLVLQTDKGEGNLKNSNTTKRREGLTEYRIPNRRETISKYVRCAALSGLCVVLVLFSFQLKSVVPIESSGHLLSETIQDKLGIDAAQTVAWIRLNTVETSSVLAWGNTECFLRSYCGRRTYLSSTTVAHDREMAAMAALAMISSEGSAWHVLRHLDVEYVVVSFAGISGTGGGHSEGGDDMDNFMGFVDLAASAPAASYLQPLNRTMFLNSKGRVAIDKQVTYATQSSILFKMSYRGFQHVITDSKFGLGYDIKRKVTVKPQASFLYFNFLDAWDKGENIYLMVYPPLCSHSYSRTHAHFIGGSKYFPK